LAASTSSWKKCISDIGGPSLPPLARFYVAGCGQSPQAPQGQDEHRPPASQANETATSLLPALDGCKIVALSVEGATLETPGGARQSYRRKPDQPGRVLVWKVGS
jgi:hypothetical protein